MADDLAVHSCSCSVRAGPVHTSVPVRRGYRGIRQVLGSLQSCVLPSVATVFVSPRGNLIWRPWTSQSTVLSRFHSERVKIFADFERSMADLLIRLRFIFI
jgi:hypothetical protein